jgi:arginine/serine-rich splicing factor 4/5/6
MTQLYVGNLSTDADDKVLRAVFGKYGPIRETIMKNGYAFIEYESSTHADAATSELNGAEILGSHLIVEPSHQQRITKQTWNSE